MKILFIASSLFLTLSLAHSQGRLLPKDFDPQSLKESFPSSTYLIESGRVLDMAVNNQGLIGVLLNKPELEFIDVESRISTLFPFDLSSTTPNLPSSIRTLRLAIDQNDSPVILWSGVDGDGRRTYVTNLDKERTVALERNLWQIKDFAVGPRQSIFVLGLQQDLIREVLEDRRVLRWVPEGNPDLVHEFSATGEFVRSFHPFSSEERDQSFLMWSSLVVAGDSVFVVNGRLSDKVHEYSNGELVHTYDLEHLPEEWGRAPQSLFSRDGKVYVGSTVAMGIRSDGGTLSYGFSEQEVSVIENGKSRTVLKTKDIDAAGQIIGVTSEGQFLGRTDLSIEGTGERFPLVFVAGEVLQ